jgi:hypothetical protein
MMASGIEMPIREIQAGDEILVYDITIGTQRSEPVGEVIVRQNVPMVRITFDDGTYINASMDHPFETREGPCAITNEYAYKKLAQEQIGKLTIGTCLVTYDLRHKAIVKLEVIPCTEPVYTFSNMMFFANQLLVY